MKLAPSADPAPPAASVPEPHPPAGANRLFFLAAVVIFVFGAILRLAVKPGFEGYGFDERLYRLYVLALDQRGLSGYPVLCESYIVRQHEPSTAAELPPTRFLYIFSAWVAKRVGFGDAPPATFETVDPKNHDPALISLKRVSRCFSILFVGLAGVAIWRMLGPPIALGTMALVAAAPLSIHLGAHALIDGFFAFWATLCVWLWWENLQRPNERWRLAALTVALALLIIAKENSAFVVFALGALGAVSRRAKFGAVTRPLVIASFAGLLLGLGVLVCLAGGPGSFIEIYRLLTAKAPHLAIAISTGDGPWYRYLVDLLTLDPLVLILALSGMITLPREKPAFLFLLGFVAFSYAIMCNIPFGMNLRYTAIWTIPLCAFASAQILSLATLAGRRWILTGIILFAFTAAGSLRQYRVFFIDAALYELGPGPMLRAVNILKPPPPQ